MKKQTLLHFLCCIILLCGPGISYGTRWGIASTSAISGADYCYGGVSPAYSTNWTRCTLGTTAPGSAIVNYEWFIDGTTSTYTTGILGTFNPLSTSGMISLTAGQLSSALPALSGSHTLYVKYTWTNYTGCASSPLWSAGYAFTVGHEACISASAYPSTICSGGTSTLSSSISNTDYDVVNAAAFYIAPTSTHTSISFSDLDEGSSSVAIPFPFFFYGTAYTSVVVHVNGYISFGNSTEDHNSYTVPTSSEVPNIIAAFQHDLDLTGSAFGDVNFTTNGTAPNRTFVVAWTNVPDHGGGANNTGQIVLYEGGCGQFDINLLDVPSNVATCGVQNAAGTVGVAPPGRNGGGSAWAVSASTPETWHFTGSAGSGYSYSWAPMMSIATAGTGPIESTTALSLSTTYTVTVTDGIGCSASAVVPVTVTGYSTMFWLGTTHDWQNPINWTCGHVPMVTEDVTIGSTYADPIIGVTGTSSGYANNLTITPSSMAIITLNSLSNLTVAGDLTIGATDAITVSSGTFVQVTGNVENQGIVAGDGKLVMNGLSPQTIKSNGTGSSMRTISNLELTNDVSILWSGFDPIGITGSVTFTPGYGPTFTTNDYLVLVSNAYGTARIGEISSGASVSGQVTCQQYIPGGYRAWRFFGHPYNANLSSGLYQIINSHGVDISGTGGASNNFVNSSTNSPTAYYYKTLSSNSMLSNDPGWTAYTNGMGGTGNEYGQYQGIRVLVKGAHGEGFYPTGYTPSATTYSMIGYINQGDQNVPLVCTTTIAASNFSNFSIPYTGYYDYSRTYNCLSNPYPSPVDIGAVLSRNYSGPTAQYSNTTSASDLLYSSFFWVFQPDMGTSGQYLPVSFCPTVSPYYGSFSIPANTMFEVRANPIYSLTPTLVFHETDKTATSTNPASGGGPLLKMSPDFTVLNVYGPGNKLWDIVKLQFNDNATGKEDVYLDAGKRMGFDYNFFTMSEDKHALSWDFRPFTEDQSITLGMTGETSEYLTIRVASTAIPDGKALYLHDKLLGNFEQLKPGMEYPFYYDAVSTTQGDRFELAMKPAPVTGNGNNFVITVTPNPVANDVSVFFTASQTEHTVIRIMDAAGREVAARDAGVRPATSATLSLAGMAPGIYVVEVTCGKNKATQKIVKQ